jgi:hypothetical protein
MLPTPSSPVRFVLEPSTWGSPVELEVRRRISISVAAYAYEIASKPIMSDQMFDWLAEKIDRRQGTCHPVLDEFFAYEFSPMTGMWIYQHPELPGIEKIFTRYYDVMKDYFNKGGIR